MPVISYRQSHLRSWHKRSAAAHWHARYWSEADMCRRLATSFISRAAGR